MKYDLKVSTLINFFIVISLLHFFKVIPFFTSLVQGGERSLDADLEGNIINQIFGIFILLFSFFLILLRKYSEKIIFSKIIFVSYLLFLISVVLTVFWSYEPMLTLRRYVAFLTIVVFCLYLVLYNGFEKAVRIFLFVLFISAAISLILGIIFPSQTFVKDGLREGAFMGVYGEKNAAARLNAFGLLLYLSLPNKTKIFNFLAFCSLAVVILTKSVTALIILVLGYFTFIFFKTSFKSSNGSFYFCLFSIFFYAFFLLALKYISDYILIFLGRDPDLTDRLLIWELLSDAISEEFYHGYGFGAFWGSIGSDEFIERWGYIGNAHNGYFEILLAGGVFLFIPFLLLLLVLLFSLVVSALKDLSCIQNFNVSIMSLVIVIIMLIINTVAFIIPNHRSAEMLFFLLITTSLFVGQNVKK